MILLIPIHDSLHVRLISSFKFQSDSINTLRSEIKISQLSLFKFQSDFINTITLLSLARFTAFPLNSNLILLIPVTGTAVTGTEVTFKFQSDFINTLLVQKCYTVYFSLNSNMILLIRNDLISVILPELL